ncbi:hypothetical protein [Sporomusa sphaeroides]|uniref:Uncharacterized protein n=1 Tax=Sporomusa sphaeroides DSM 2875 TaxID=1337886 RepID=A0ABP2C467_9FIRM|nr:hypothetical protein [Sporomusa sphaeroides]OLS56153.1 hypothetical protein SPSPH_25420 [Sporomusa sphaeroides DSM 2875]CVK19205.1 hypothetical protein SSPH_01854 [Sporomusa sphaeroides DSM 2875]
MYNKVKKIIKSIIAVGGNMTELIKVTIKNVLCSDTIMPDLWPDTDYRKHVPKSAKQLAERNWKTTGSSLRKAMDKVGSEDGPKV